jgi:hypothetical protein
MFFNCIGWEQSYNCGRDDGVFETMGRLAGFMKEKGEDCITLH